MLISINTEKIFEKTQNPFIIKILKKKKSTREVSQSEKGHLKKTQLIST